jgi:hypothetical protein
MAESIRARTDEQAARVQIPVSVTSKVALRCNPDYGDRRCTRIRGCLHVRFPIRIPIRFDVQFATKDVQQVKNVFFILLKCVNKLL